MVTERVVDLLEAVEIQHQDRDPASVSLGREQRVLNAIEEEGSVW